MYYSKPCGACRCHGGGRKQAPLSLSLSLSLSDLLIETWFPTKLIISTQTTTHEKLAQEMNDIIESPSKIKLNVSSDLVEPCYFPIVQSGGQYQLKVDTLHVSRQQDRQTGIYAWMGWVECFDGPSLVVVVGVLVRDQRGILVPVWLVPCFSVIDLIFCWCTGRCGCDRNAAAVLQNVDVSSSLFVVLGCSQRVHHPLCQAEPAAKTNAQRAYQTTLACRLHTFAVFPCRVFLLSKPYRAVCFICLLCFAVLLVFRHCSSDLFPLSRARACSFV